VPLKRPSHALPPPHTVPPTVSPGAAQWLRFRWGNRLLCTSSPIDSFTWPFFGLPQFQRSELSGPRSCSCPRIATSYGASLTPSLMRCHMHASALCSSNHLRCSHMYSSRVLIPVTNAWPRRVKQRGSAWDATNTVTATTLSHVRHSSGFKNIVFAYRKTGNYSRSARNLGV
jgi:hypothetical protein